MGKKEVSPWTKQVRKGKSYTDKTMNSSYKNNSWQENNLVVARCKGENNSPASFQL